MKVALVSLYNRKLSFSLRSLSASLRQAGHDPQLVFFKEMELAPVQGSLFQAVAPSGFAAPARESEKELLLDVLRQLAPDLVGFSVISPQVALAAELSRRVRRELQRPVIWGGIHPTLCPEPSLAEAEFVCVGEGEEALAEFLDRFPRAAPDQVRGIWTRLASGQIVRQGARPFVADLDRLPYPDRDETLGNKYYLSRGKVWRTSPPQAEFYDHDYPIQSSRGCPHSCAYCANSALHRALAGCGPRHRRRSPAHVIGELRRMRGDPAYDCVHFWDEMFISDRPWLEEFCELYRREIGLPISVNAHPEELCRETLEPLRRAGLSIIDIGLQSGSRRMLQQVYQRRQKVERLPETGRLLKELKIFPYFDIILNDPYEESEDLRQTLEMLLSLPRPFNANLFSLSFYPGARLTEKALREGVLRAEETCDPGQLNGFFLSFERVRRKEHYYLYSLIAMSPLAFVPRGLLRWLSRRAVLARAPWLLTLPMSLVMRLAAWRRGERLRRRGLFPERRQPKLRGAALELTTFRAAGGGRLELALRLHRRPAGGALSLDIYPLYEGAHPARHVGYWNLRLRGDEPETLPIDFCYPAALFGVNGRRRPPDEQWLGDFRQEGLYKIDLLLYDRRGRLLDRLSLRSDAPTLFAGEGRFLAENQAQPVW